MEDVPWKDGLELGLRGLGWRDAERASPYDRFPLAMKDRITPNLWGLSQQSAGLYLEFTAATRDIFVRWKLDGAPNNGFFDAPSGRSGVDLYGQDEAGRWWWVGTKEAWREPESDGKINRLPLDGQRRKYRLYLPLHRRLREVAVGCAEGVAPVAPPTTNPIVYYGTSIVHGVGVSRAGLAHAAWLGRALNREIINLGFSGSAFCETAVAEALGQLKTPLFIIDVLPNNAVEVMESRLTAFYRTLRAAQPDTLILFLGDRVYGDAAFCPERKAVFTAKNDLLQKLITTFRGSMPGPLELFFADSWYGIDNEGTTDASHPNDLGAARMARQLIPLVERLLREIAKA